MLKKLIGFMFVGLMVFSGVGYAAQTTGISPEGIRADGMGGAYAGLAEGPEGVFYNPAGLVKMKESVLVLPSVYLKQTSEQIISPKILPTITSFKNFLQVWENILVDSF